MYDGAIYEIARAVEYALGEVGMLDFGCGVCYHNDVFEMHGFWQHVAYWEDDEDVDYKNDWLFWHKPSGFKYTWYKRIGRSSEIVSESGLKTLDWYKAVVECIESVKSDPDPQWRCARHDG